MVVGATNVHLESEAGPTYWRRVHEQMIWSSICVGIAWGRVHVLHMLRGLSTPEGANRHVLGSNAKRWIALNDQSTHL